MKWKSLSVLFLALFLFECSASKEPAPAVVVVFRAKSDEGRLLAGVKFVTGAQVFGTTQESGEASVGVRAAEGSHLPVSVVCPEGFKSPTEGLLVLPASALTDNGALRTASFEATCTRSLRDVVVVVHATGAGKIPVLIDGERVGVTDSDGNVHVSFKPPAHATRFVVSLDTTSFPEHRPKNPTRVFEHLGRDTIALFEQSFTQLKVEEPEPADPPVVLKRTPVRRLHSQVPIKLSNRPTKGPSSLTSRQQIPYKTEDPSPW